MPDSLDDRLRDLNRGMPDATPPIDEISDRHRRRRRRARFTALGAATFGLVVIVGVGFAFVTGDSGSDQAVTVDSGASVATADASVTSSDIGPLEARVISVHIDDLDAGVVDTPTATPDPIGRITIGLRNTSGRVITVEESPASTIDGTLVAAGGTCGASSSELADMDAPEPSGDGRYIGIICLGILETTDLQPGEEATVVLTVWCRDTIEPCESGAHDLEVGITWGDSPDDFVAPFQTGRLDLRIQI